MKFSTKRLLGWVLLWLAVMGGQSARAADAYVLNLNFGSGSKTGLVEIASSQTVGNSTNDVWNLIGPSALSTTTNLHVSTGSNTTISVTITNLELGPTTIYGHPDAMLGSYIRGYGWDDYNSVGVPASIVVSNLPAATYTVYCYGFGNDPSYEYELFSLTAGTNSYAQKQTAQAGPFDPVNDAMTEGWQYVVFTNVVVGAGQPVNFLLNQSFYNHTVNGIQFVSYNTTPTLPSVSFSPVSGTGTPVSVTLSVSGHGDAAIYYTTNGTTPTTNSYVYSSALSFEVATTVKAFATKSGYNDSSVATATYPLSQLPLVTFNPTDGAGVPTNVVLTVTGHTNATIYFTTNGTTPTTSSTVYSSPIALNTNGWTYSANRVPTMTSYTTPAGSLVTNSSVYSSAYGWNAFDHSTSTYWIANGAGPEWVSLEFPSTRRVAKYALSSTTGGDAPKDWTLEGWNGASYVVVDTRSTETNWNALERREYVCTNSAAYTNYRLNVSAQNATVGNPSAYVIVAEVEMFEASITIQAFATETNWLDSDLAFADYHARPQDQQQVAPTPFLSPDSGTFNNDTAITINSPLSGATYQYTTNGTDWVTYTSAFTLDRNTTLQGKTSKSGYVTSLERTNSYAFVVATPGISPNGGNFTNSVAVTLTSATTGASFEYKIGGGSWQSYTGTFNITNTAVLTVAGDKSNYGSSTNTATFTAIDTNSPPGQLLNLNFGSGTKVGYAAVGNATNDVWNVIGASALSTSTNLVWANGSNSLVSVVVKDLDSAGSTSYPDAVLGTYIYGYASESTLPEIHISGLSSNVYDIYYLALSDYPESEAFEFQWQIDSGSMTWSGSSQTESDSGIVNGPYKEGLHVLAIRNLALDAGQTLKIYPSSSYYRGFVNGLQIMRRGPVALTLPKPEMSPGTSTNTEPVTVTIRSPWVGATNRYSLDNGSTWVTNSSVILEATATVIAQSFRSGYDASGFTTNTYTVNLPVALSPGVTPAGAEYAEAKTITLYSALAGASYRYSTNNGSTWLTNNTLRLTNDATVLAQTVKYGYLPSATVTNAYTINTNLTVVLGGLVNINFGSGTKVGFAATGLITNDYWNVVGATASAQSFTNPITTLKWSDTNTAGVTLVTSNLVEEVANFHGDAMLGTYLRGNYYGGEYSLGAEVKVNNLPSGTYDLYVYILGQYHDYSSEGQYSDEHAGVSMFTSTETNTVKYANPDFVTVDGETAMTENLQYVVFTNVTVAAGTALTLKLETQGYYYLLNGLQIRNPNVSLSLPAVTFTPGSGTTVPTNVVLSVSGHSDATIYYTTNGTTPTTNSAVYSSSLAITNALTLKAFATKAGYESTAVSSASYILPMLPTVIFSPGSGATVPVSVALSVTGHTNATIYYTTNGTTPTTSDTVYSGAITLTNTITIKAIAMEGGYSDSSVAEASYTYTGVPSIDLRLINMDFGGVGGKVGSALVGIATNDVWNGIGAEMTGGERTTTNLLWAFGGTSPVSITISNLTDSSYDTWPQDAMLKTALRSTAMEEFDGLISSYNALITISNLPPAQYSFIIYGNMHDREHDVSEGSPFNWDQTASPHQYHVYFGNAHIQRVDLGRNTNQVDTGWVEGWNYGVISNLTVTTGQVVRVVLTGYPWAYNLISGMQIAGSTNINVLPSVSFLSSNGEFAPTDIEMFVPAHDNAVIYYTVDGSTPTTNSFVYTNAIHLSGTATVKAMATKMAYAPSAVSSGTYTMPPSPPSGEGLLNIAFAEGDGWRTGQAVVGVSTNDFWNGFGYGEFPDAGKSHLKWAGGTTSQVSVAISNLLDVDGGGYFGSYRRGVAGEYTQTPTSTVTVGNLPAGEYNLFIYSQPGDGSVQDIQIKTNGEFVTWLTVSGGGAYAWTYGSNYTAISNLVIGTEQVLEIGLSTTNYYNVISALQIFGATNTNRLSAVQFVSTNGNFIPTQVSLVETQATNATIYYTINGSNPTTSSLVYTDPVYLTNAVTIKAIAVMDGYKPSYASSNSFTVPQLPSVEFDPPSGSTVPTVVTLAVPGHTNAIIYYTTNGIAPTTNSLVYSNALSIDETMVVRAYARKAWFADALKTSAVYLGETLPEPIISPGGGSYVNPVVVTVQSFWTNGIVWVSTNSSGWFVYEGAFTLMRDTEVRAMVEEEYVGSSITVTETFTFPDTDGDGLTDAQEVALGTNPAVVDTDGDGKSDYEEFVDGTDPLNPTSALAHEIAYIGFEATDFVKPIISQNADPISLNGNAVAFFDVQRNIPTVLSYPTVINPGATNVFDREKGSVAFMFRPLWSSQNTGGSGPGADGVLLKWDAYGGDDWQVMTLYITPDGNSIVFRSDSLSQGTQFHFTAPVSMASTNWNHIVFGYSTNRTTLYLNGEKMADGSGIPVPMDEWYAYWGFTIGSDGGNGNYVPEWWRLERPLSYYQQHSALWTSSIQMMLFYYEQGFYDYVYGWIYDMYEQMHDDPDSDYYGADYSSWYNNWFIPNYGQTYDYDAVKKMEYEYYNRGWLGISAYYDGQNHPIKGYLDFVATYDFPVRDADIASLYGAYRDSDGDGIPDSVEVEIGTDPLIIDTDGDGIPDGWEVRFGLDPLDPADAGGDLDSDGLTNLQEYQLGTRPDLVDTDGDGISDYYEWLYGTLPTADDSDGDGLTDGEEFILGTNPHSIDTDQDGLTDAQEIAMGTDPLNPDTDGDGLLDGWESSYGTNPLVADTDGDGLPDGDEVFNNLNPRVNDSYQDNDGDGLTNLEEIAAGTRPDKADTDDDGISDYDEIYVYFTDPLNPDTDGDGVRDGRELLDGTDPLDATSFRTTVGGGADDDGLSDLLETALGSSSSTADTDYDGRTDYDEWRDGTSLTDPTSKRSVLLGRWKFNTSALKTETGVSPVAASGTNVVTGIEGLALMSDLTSGYLLRYPETDSAKRPLINCREGTIRFWFRPDWDSGTGPTVATAFVEVGGGTNGGVFALRLNAAGNQLQLVSGSDTNNLVTNLTSSISFTNGIWTHIVITFSASSSQLYTNGLAGVTGSGVSHYPDAATRQATGIKVGGAESNGASVVGRMDELATFNYVQTADEIAADDSDGDSLSDALERTLGTNPSIRDTNSNGTSDGVEYYQGQPFYLDVFTPLR